MQFPFRRIWSSRDSSSQVSQKCWAILGTCLRWLGHLLRVRWYRVLYTGSYLMTPQMASRSAVDSCTCWMFWWIGIGRDSWWEGKQLRQLANTIFYWLVLYSVVIFLNAEKHALRMGWGCVDGLLLDHFQWLMFILCNYMPVI